MGDLDNQFVEAIRKNVSKRCEETIVSLIADDMVLESAYRKGKCNELYLDKWRVVLRWIPNDHYDEYKKIKEISKEKEAEERDRIVYEYRRKGRRRFLLRATVLPPNVLNNETQLIMSKFDSQEEASNFCGYLGTNFVRFIVDQEPVDCESLKNSFRYVPRQNFSKPWSDRELYDKYKLSQTERDYIESTIKLKDANISEEDSNSDNK